MKKSPLTTLLLAGLMLAAWFQTGCVAQHDSVAQAKRQTEARGQDANQCDAKFLIEMADARMMDSKEGQLAAERGTTDEIRGYGQLMVTDQAKLLAEIQALAGRENIVLPATISDAKADGYADLQKLNGEPFDQKFIGMITIDHERDVKQFKLASEENQKFSAGVSGFAQQQLPLIQSHLNKIKAIAKP